VGLVKLQQTRDAVVTIPRRQKLDKHHLFLLCSKDG
jgi:hypothetical protein